MGRIKSLENQKRYLGLDDQDPFCFDVGCKTATAYLHITKKNRCKSHCQRCPFPECIYEMSILERRYLNASATLKSLYFLHDNDVNIITICEKLGIEQRFAGKCIRERKNIEELLAEWNDIIRHRVAFEGNTVIRVKLRTVYE